MAKEAEASAAVRAELLEGREEIRRNSLELARIGARLQAKDELLRAGLAQNAELSRTPRARRGEIRRRGDGASEPSDAAFDGYSDADPTPRTRPPRRRLMGRPRRALEQAALQALVTECVLAGELLAAEARIDEAMATTQALSGEGRLARPSNRGSAGGAAAGRQRRRPP